MVKKVTIFRKRVIYMAEDKLTSGRPSGKLVIDSIYFIIFVLHDVWSKPQT